MSPEFPGNLFSSGLLAEKPLILMFDLCPYLGGFPRQLQMFIQNTRKTTTTSYLRILIRYFLLILSPLVPQTGHQSLSLLPLLSLERVGIALIAAKLTFNVCFACNNVTNAVYVIKYSLKS